MVSYKLTVYLLTTWENIQVNRPIDTKLPGKDEHLIFRILENLEKENKYVTFRDNIDPYYQGL